MQTTMVSERFAVSRPRAIRLPRVDLYGPIHKGLRWALARMVSRLGNETMTDPVRAASLLDDLDELLTFCSDHIRHEDLFIHPAIEARRAGAAAGLASSHVEHAETISELRFIMNTLRTAPSDTIRPLTRTLYLCFGAFMAENFAHMAEEEEITQPLLEELYSDEELVGLHTNLMAQLSPGELVASLLFMLPAINEEERVHLLAGPKAAMPADVFDGLFRAGRRYLTDEEVATLMARLPS